MRQSNVCSPAQNQACLLITSRLYDRRGLDCTSPLPLFNSLAHLVHLTATSPKIREILTRDGGLERLVRILRDFVANPPPVQDVGGFYGLLPPIPLGNSGAATAIASMNPSMTPTHNHYGITMSGHSGSTFTSSHALPTNPAFPNEPNQPLSFDGADPSQQTPRSINDPRPFDRDAAQRFSLAFQSIVNVGVRGSEAIRSRVVQAGTLEVVASILEAWLINKGFPLVMPRRGKRRETNADNASLDPNGINGQSGGQSAGDVDTDERMDEDAMDSVAGLSRPSHAVRSRASASTSHSSSRARAEGRSGRPGSSSNASSISRASTSTSRAPSSSARPSSSSRASTAATQTTPRHALSSVSVTATPTPTSQSNSVLSSANASTSSLVPTPSEPSPSPIPSQTVQAPISRGRSGTIVANRAAHGDSSREHSTDEMENDADTERTGGRSGTNTEDEDMDAESSNNEVEMETANTSATNSDGGTAEPAPSAPGTARVVHRPVAVADPQALSPHTHTDSLSLPTNGPGMGMGIGMGMGMGLEVDVLAAVNMVMTHEGVAAFEGTQFGGEAANAAAAEAVARAGREGIMEEETPRAVLRNMSERVHPSAMGAAAAAAGELGQVDEEMRDARPDPEHHRSPSRTPSRSRATSENPMNVDNPTPTHTTVGIPPANLAGRPTETRPATTFEDNVALGGGETTIGGPTDALGVPRMIPNQINPHDLGPHAPQAAVATAQAIAAANAAAVNANRNRFRVMVGDAGPFRQEDVLRALQLLAYLTKYPHVRQEFYKKRVHMPPGMGVPLGSGGTERPAGMQMNVGRLDATTSGSTMAQIAPAIATVQSGQMPQITTLFSLVERFTFRPSMSHLSLNPSVMIPTIPPEIQSWAAVIMRNACRKDDSQGGIRQCANMTCGKWERTPREFAKCRRCRKAKYCGKECQSKAWSMGHRYWCSAREGEPGQVPPENLDHDNEDATSTTAVNGDNQVDANTPTTAGTTGMGIGIAPNGGVGLVPLNNPQPQTGAQTAAARDRGRPRGGDQGAAQTAGAAYTARGPIIAGYAWDAPPATTTTRPSTASTSQASTAASTSTATNSNTSGGSSRRRDGTPTGSSGSSRFGRGLTERIRALGAAGNPAPVTTALMQHMGIQAPAPSVIAPADPSTVRPRAWDRLFGREVPYTGSSPTAEAGPSPRDITVPPSEAGWARVSRPTRSSSGPIPSTSDSSTANDAEQMRQYMSMSSRNRAGGATHNASYLADESTPSTSQPSTDLSGMVRNNLVLAAQPGSSSLPNSNVVSMRVTTSTTVGPNERPTNGYGSTTSRTGLATRSNSTGGSLTMLDTAIATGSMWNAYSTDSDHGME